MIQKLKDLLTNTRELVILAPLAAIVLLVILHLVAYLTGRPTAVSLVPLVEFGINLLRFTVCGAFAALFQASALGYRAAKSGTHPLSDDVCDAAIFLALFITALVATSVF